MVSRLSFATASWIGLQGQEAERDREFAKEMLCVALHD